MLHQVNEENIYIAWKKEFNHIKIKGISKHNFTFKYRNI